MCFGYWSVRRESVLILIPRLELYFFEYKHILVNRGKTQKKVNFIIVMNYLLKKNIKFIYNFKEEQSVKNKCKYELKMLYKNWKI